MKPRITLLTLGVDDLERALAFYRDWLGLPTKGIVGQEYENGAELDRRRQEGFAMCRRRASIVLALATALTGCGQSPGDAAAAELRLRSTLDSVVRLAQEAHHAEHGYFAGDLARLGLTGLDPNVQVYFRAANEHGWSASATHRGWPSRPCVLNVGDPPGYAALPTGSVIRPARIGPPGEVVCVPLEE